MSSKHKLNLVKKNKKFIILGDEEQLNRVFLNLIKNAVDSLDEKSKEATNNKAEDKKFATS